MEVRKIFIMKATRLHARMLARTIRPADAEEILASSGLPPYDAIYESMKMCKNSCALFLHGELAAIFGVVRAHSEREGGVFGIVWAITATPVDKHPKDFWRASQALVAEYHKEYGMLANMVDARYSAALRWLARLGFTIHPTQPHGPNKMPFHRAQLARIR